MSVRIDVIPWDHGRAARIAVCVEGQRVVSAAWGLDHSGHWSAGFPGFEVSCGDEGGEAAARAWLRAVGEACIKASEAEVPRD